MIRGIPILKNDLSVGRSNHATTTLGNPIGHPNSKKNSMHVFQQSSTSQMLPVDSLLKKGNMSPLNANTDEYNKERGSNSIETGHIGGVSSIEA